MAQKKSSSKTKKKDKKIITYCNTGVQAEMAYHKLKEKGWGIWDAIKRWWEGVPEMKVPVTLKECNFTFKADGITKVVPFQTTFK